MVKIISTTGHVQPDISLWTHMPHLTLPCQVIVRIFFSKTEIWKISDK
ncbi:MAG: hypothetical protein J6P09_06255 [Methanobrevibacter sp.]|nr:hypothetical protein [Methanobrevibacter sp.]